MKFTKMEVKGQLDAEGAREFSRLLALSYVIAACAAGIGALAALVYAVRWW